MGTKYTTQTISGYNSSAPPDDGSTGSTNLLKWSNHKTKLADPIKTLAEDINSALVTALNFGSRTVAVDDTSAAADHMKTVECTASLTASLLDATTAGAGYVISYKNLGSGTVTIALQTSSDTLDGVANGTLALTPNQSVVLKTNTSANGYDIISAYTGSGISSSLPRSYLTGCYITPTASATSTLSIAAGQCMDSTNTLLLNLTALTKSTSAWAVGSSGGLDTGTIANSTWYYFYVIQRPDTGVVDVCYSTSSSLPNLTTGHVSTAYTKYRYIGAALTDGSGNWTPYLQFGREFWWITPGAVDLNGGTSTTGANVTLNVPLGRNMKAFMNAVATNTIVYISNPSFTNSAPSQTVSPLTVMFNTSATAAGAEVHCWTDTSAQIRYRLGTANGCYIVTLGWLDLADTNL